MKRTEFAMLNFVNFVTALDNVLEDVGVFRSCQIRTFQVLLFLRGLLPKFDNRQCKVSPRA